MDAGSKRLVTGGLVAAGAMLVMAGTVIGAGIAHAEPNPYAPWSGPLGDHSASAFWLDAVANGATGSPAQAESLAQTICTALQNPKLQDADLIEGMADGNAYKVPSVTLIVHAAEWHFCPDRY